jgi:pimeloyl-ACP methyl ester carboxylesterase
LGEPLPGDDMKPLSVRGTELWCVDHGNGVPLLLVHGFPLDHTMWAGQIEGLSSRCRGGKGDSPHLPERPAGCSAQMGTVPFSPVPIRVIAPDLRGFGRSRKTADDKVTIADFADDLAALLDVLQIGEPVVFCGLSMGGYIAFQFWRRHADRLRALILCDTRAVADAPEAAAARAVMADRVLREGSAPLVETMLPQMLGATTRRQRPDLLENVRRVMLSTDPRAIAAASRGLAERPDVTALLPDIRCPTLVVVGSEDTVSAPAEMRGIADAIPGARFVEIPSAGHLSPLEKPAAVNAAIAEFLTPLPGRARTPVPPTPFRRHCE